MHPKCKVEIGPKGGILHVNRQFISMNAKDGGNRPVFTLKANGEKSRAIYARDMHWTGETSAVGTMGQQACGARAWIALAPGTKVRLIDRMSFNEAKAA